MARNHYTYRITNLIENKHYYGSRTCDCNPIKDLGIKYFSSSSDKKFVKDQKLNPENYKYKVIKTFKTRKEAIQFEIKLHNYFNVGINESFYNKVKQTSTGFDTTGIPICLGRILSDKTKEKISKGNKGKQITEETKRKISKALQNTRRNFTSEHKKKLSKSNIGKVICKNKTTNEIICVNQDEFNKNNELIGIHKNRKLTEEHKRKISESGRGLKRKTIICPHCGKIGSIANMKRWHFENCKFKGDK